ncbi:MAG TPA: AraC family transcriptional regulator [Mucilaginibacter sp.]|nr:AraC family transcriptional regulator [Mucilaginibacter sp.]
MADQLRIGEVKEYIDQHLSEELPLKKIATKFNYTLWTLKRHFKIRYAVSISKYILEIRMEGALIMLINRQASIVEIAEMVGYNNVSSFSHTFRKYFGKAPTIYMANDELVHKLK